MKTITIVSGKGGSGKTSLTASFASLAENAVLVDCDVEGSNLPVLFDHKIQSVHSFPGEKIAHIHAERCTACGICVGECRFDAISGSGDGFYKVDPLKCEGCRLCHHVCPHNAVDLVDGEASSWYISETRFGPMLYGQLSPGESLSGKLVTLLREESEKLATEKGKNLLLVDGPPGIACPVIASITGSDLLVLIAEPSVSGFHDFKRVFELGRHFRSRMLVIINKWNINPDITLSIRQFCEEMDLPVIASLPFDASFTEAMMEKKSMVEMFPDRPVSKEIKNAWEKLHFMTF